MYAVLWALAVVVRVFLYSPCVVQWYWGPLKPVVRVLQLASRTAPVIKRGMNHRELLIEGMGNGLDCKVE